MLKTLDYTIHIGSTPTFLYFDLSKFSYLAMFPSRDIMLVLMTLLTSDDYSVTPPCPQDNLLENVPFSRY